MYYSAKKFDLKKVLTHLLFIGYSMTVIYPLLLVLFNSFKSTQEIFSSPYGLPTSLKLDNYINAWETANFAGYFKNSLFVTLVSIVLILFLSSMASYVLARFKFKGNILIYFFFLLGLMLPIRLAIIPLFILLRDLGLLDSYTGLILVYVASGIPFSIFILYTFFQSIPEELSEAARVEGASSFKIYYMIMLPLVRPALATVAIFNFISLWNDFFFPFILLRDPEKYTLPVGLSKFFGEYSTDWASLFAGLSLSIIPVVIVFFILSKQFVEGLTAGAVK